MKEKQVSLQVFIAIIFLILGVGLIAGNLLSYGNNYFPPSIESINQLWSSDHAKLMSEDENHDDGQWKTKKHLIDMYKRVSQVRYLPTTDITQTWVNGIQAPFPLNKDGDLTLEVLLLHWTEEERSGFILQYDFIDQNSGDTLYEYGRTFRFSQ